MPRCYPPAPEFGEGRHGERAVWEALQQTLPDEAALMYSIWLVEEGHEYEIDFLVVWPDVGIGVIEVKGGHVTRDDSGRWFMSKGQERRQTAHPLVQAADARHALQRYLKRTGTPGATARTQHMIAMPHMPVPQEHELYIAREALPLPALYYAHERQVMRRKGLLVPLTAVTSPEPGETVETVRVRFRTVGDMTCTCPVESAAANADEVVVETLSVTVSERGATRMDDRTSDASMERRKKEGYF